MSRRRTNRRNRRNRRRTRRRSRRRQRGGGLFFDGPWLKPWSWTPKWLRCGAILARVLFRANSRNHSSPVASNCRTPEPNSKPCVHSVHPLVVYLPAAVKTGDPLAWSYSLSMSRIFAPESSQNRVNSGLRSGAERLGSGWSMAAG